MYYLQTYFEDYSLKGISLTLLVAIYANIEDFNADFQKFQMTD